MVWKILSGIAAACLGAALYFAVINKEALKAERDLAERAKKDHASLITRKQQAEEAHKTKLAKLDSLKKELDDTKQKVAKAAADSQEKDAALQLAKNTLTQVVTQVDTIQKKIDELGNVEKLLAQVAALKKDQETAEGAVASQTQQLAMKKEAVNSLQSDIARYRDLEVRARKGIVEPSFTARVASVFSNWGFVILNKGNAGGVFANAELEVKRGKDVIAKLKVRNVEQQISVADVIPGSVAEGNSLRSGDLVVAAPNQPSISAPAPTGGPAAPVEAPAGAVPVTPAPANAAMGNDPFGASPIPAGGAPTPAAPAPGGAMGSDPFGATPPAPAGGAAGTKESPSTADPFGGTPAKPAEAAPAAPATTPPPAAGAVDPFAPPPAK